jgi:Carboxypeptidase regulatory-like domain
MVSRGAKVEIGKFPLTIRKSVQVLGASLAVLLFCLPVFSQLNLGRIFGGIADQTGGAIADATVIVTDVQRGISRTLTTDEAGEYSAPSLTPGTYTVRAEAKGFKAIERQNIIVGVGQDVRVDLSVQPGEQTQTVTVTESIPVIQTTSAQLTEVLENQTINELPLNGREFTKLLAYRPGAKSNGLDIYANGNRASSNSWMFDGLEDFNEWSAFGPIVVGQNMFDEATILPIDTIQEVNVVDVPKAEYGWKPGAEVNVG